MASIPISCPAYTASMNVYSPMTAMPTMAGRLSDIMSLPGVCVSMSVRLSCCRTCRAMSFLAFLVGHKPPECRERVCSLYVNHV